MPFDWSKPKRRERELIVCEECGGTYFEAVDASQYFADHSVVLGQQIPPRPDQAPFQFLRCILCGKLREPNVLRGARDCMNEKYDAFLDQLEEKKEKEKIEKESKEKIVEKEVIPAEDL